ncbi:MAG: helix-turn-helix domain-containing protein [Candidatus Acidiferrales bacterium]
MSKTLVFQTRALRDREGWSQEKLASKVGMTQNQISRLENPSYGKATITTLKRIAAVFDVALVVRFVPFSQLADWVSGTPFVDPGLSMESLAVPSFSQENQAQASLGSVPQNAIGRIEDVQGAMAGQIHDSMLGSIVKRSPQSAVSGFDRANAA